MKSANSSSHGVDQQNSLNAARSSLDAFVIKRSAARVSRGSLYREAASKSTASSGNSGGLAKSASVSRPRSRKSSRLSSSGLPANAEKHWYGESPYPVG